MDGGYWGMDAGCGGGWGAGRCFHPHKKRVPRPSRVLCERAGILEAFPRPARLADLCVSCPQRIRSSHRVEIESRWTAHRREQLSVYPVVRRRDVS
jgi:hypothetical protein